MSSPLPTLLICLTYAYGVKVVGPMLMENRKPFNLRKPIIFYNLFQVIFSCWLFYESGICGWLSHYSYRCQPVDYSNNPTALRMVRGCWWYYFSKFTEFMDTTTSNGHSKHTNGFAKTIGICFPVQTDLYENGNINKHISKSYTLDANIRLRNRAFIDSAQAQA
ncbi:fatty acid acyl transferase-related [Holotrichia oblita]|uniref:Fatty acid acyl transferase-related n=1 Tax=Holotrichia oblita TaxID=644536 RepID=A0ACB9T5X7_HOLOL|nr:fatty acid acyl transferase-related [Holotrichia oblita]